MDAIREFKEAGGKVAAVFPIHYPRELLRAFNILPVEVWGPPGMKSNLGATHLQPYVCSIVQNGLSFLLSGGLDVTDLLLVPHTCDSLQGLGSILIDFIKPSQPVLPLYLPRGKRTSDFDFLVDELRSIYARLVEITRISPSTTDLMECILREEAADGLLRQLHHLRSLDSEFLYRLIRSREYLPSEKFLEIAQQATILESAATQNGIPVLLSGIVPEPMTIFRAINEMGGSVAADDLACCGRRLYPPGESQEPYRRMAERILGAAPDPMRGSSIQERLDYLLGLVKTSGARGVIFYEVKFCEPELFDLPLLRQGLQDAGIPSLFIEMDLNDHLAHPLLNRIAAFLEMLR